MSVLLLQRKRLMVIHMNAASADDVDYPCPELSPPAYSPVPSSEPPAYEVCMKTELIHYQRAKSSQSPVLNLWSSLCGDQK